MSYSKKPMNKTDRELVIVKMVAEATDKGVKALNKKYGKQREAMKQILADVFLHLYPGVREDQWPALLKDRVIDEASHTSHYVVTTQKGEGDNPPRDSNNSPCLTNFALAARRGLGHDDVSFMLRQALQSNVGESHFTINFGFGYGRQGTVGLKSHATKVPASKIIMFRVDGENRQVPAELQNRFLYCHKAVLKLNEETIDLVKQAFDMYEAIHAGLAAVRTPHALAELMPVAVKHFPDHWINEPKKELADPTYLNELSARLKAGLPV